MMNCVCGLSCVCRRAANCLAQGQKNVFLKTGRTQYLVHGKTISSDTQTQSCLFSIMAISARRRAGVFDSVILHTCM